MNKLRNFSQKRYYKVFRTDRALHLHNSINKDDSFQTKFAKHFEQMCLAEEPIVFPNEKITFTRTNRNVTEAYHFEDIEKEFDTYQKYYNPINNVCPDYRILLQKGLTGLKEEILFEKERASKKEADFLEACMLTISAIEELVIRYQKEAQKVQNYFVENLLKQVPMNPATSFAEALQSIRFISAMFHLSGNYQLGFGRMDQYLIDFYLHDMENGQLTKESAKELIGEFFISLNRDSDLYFGIQQGDNGQSLMLGGVKTDGTNAINELTYLFLEVSKELKLIDPKINLRIDSHTPRDLLKLGCELTKVGLGFPQYSNDEVIIPALVKAGYSLEDARNYTVAACWEFIIPGQGLDIVNQGAVSFPAAVDMALDNFDLQTVSEEQLDTFIKSNIQKQVRDILTKRDLHLLPSPLVSLFFDGAIQSKKDITQSAKYKNRGIHGSGSANAADALYIIKEYIHTNDRIKLSALHTAARHNFVGNEKLLNYVKNEAPKIGDANKKVDIELRKLFSWFADACEKYSTEQCRIRPGSGSAQFYVWLSDKNKDWIIAPSVGATIDGRLDGEPFPSSLAPAHGVKIKGLMSVLKSFSAIDYSRIINGGPITVEFSPSVFRSDEGIEKLADVIQYFVQLGNQQLQLNVLDYKVLCDAMKHPEKHSNLIVRVWGWSGYFCELAPEFQRQIINRHRYSL